MKKPNGQGLGYVKLQVLLSFCRALHEACYRSLQRQWAHSMEHIGFNTLEDYSLQECGSKALGAVDRHLLICAACCERLARIEPFNTIHYTPDGPFYSRITQLQCGSFWAHHWGCQIEGWGRYPDLASARKYLIDSFVQMYPEHECNDTCVGPRAPSR